LHIHQDLSQQPICQFQNTWNPTLFNQPGCYIQHQQHNHDPILFSNLHIEQPLEAGFYMSQYGFHPSAFHSPEHFAASQQPLYPQYSQSVPLYMQTIDPNQAQQQPNPAEQSACYPEQSYYVQLADISPPSLQNTSRSFSLPF
jgi:hypothetical protein